MFQNMVYPFLIGHIFTPFYWISQNHPFLMDQSKITPYYWISQNHPYLLDQALSLHLLVEPITLIVDISEAMNRDLDI